MTDKISSHEFYRLAEDEQVKRLASIAKEAATAYDLGGSEISKLAYRENMTFALDVGARGKFALRVHAAGYRTDAQVQSELDFMEHLAGEGILTPELLRATDSRSFVTVQHRDVPEARQCDVFRWIDGQPLRRVFEQPSLSIQETARHYADAGRLTASIYNAGANWKQPPCFERLDWDAEGIFGKTAHLGDFRNIETATDRQLGLIGDLANKLEEELKAFGQSGDRYGLAQGDLLPENLMVCRDGLRIIDFDDVGNSWVMFEIATAFCDLTESEYFGPCLNSFVEGFRELKVLPDDHLAMLPTFVLARLLSYLGHTVDRTHLEQSKEAQQMLLANLEAAAPEYLKHQNTIDDGA